jgi:tetratricopeptide (TPR) repeat protein
MKRQVVKAIVLGAGIGLTGCQAPSLGGLAFWNRGSSATASTAPDVGKQKYSGLASQFGGGDPHRPMGASSAGSTAIGQARPPEDNFLMASWKKTSAAVGGAVGGALAVKPKIDAPEDDPLRLDKVPKKIGPEVYVSAARLLENQGKFLDAEEKYKEALRAAPNDLNALVGLARLYDRQGQSSKAVETYVRAAQLYPAEGLVHNDLGLCYRRQRELEKSVVALQKAVQLQPENTKYRNNLAAALVDIGRKDEALRELSAVCAPAVAHYNLAHLLEQKSQRAQAVQHLRQALALDSGLTAAQDMLVQLTGESDAALPAFPGSAASAVGPVSALSPASMPSQAAPSIYAAQAAESASYHIGDDSSPAASMAQKPNWNAGAGAGAKPLPPIE